MYELNNEDVIHVANLAKLYVSEKDIERYKKDLEDILNKIKDIEKVDIEGDMMISPSNNSNIFSTKEETSHGDVLLNVKNKVGNFIRVEVEND